MKLSLNDFDEPEDSTRKVLIWILGVSNFALWCYQALSEIKQVKNEEKSCNHFKSVWNWFDMAGILLTLFVIVCGANEPDALVNKESLRVVAAFASFFILLKTFDWLRLFEGTAFYI